MSVYKSKYGKLHGSSYDELAPLARKEYQRTGRKDFMSVFPKGKRK
jgi:hypothetical protein